MTRKTTRRRRTPRDSRPQPDGRVAIHRGAWVAISLAGILALQLWTCRGQLGRPFLDTRLHYDFDNAAFTFQARNGIRNADLRSQFGVTLNQYSGWGERRGAAAYYTDHPFLVKALLQQSMRITGTSESASRSFYLALSFAVAAGLFTILLQTTASLPAALLGSATLVSLPLFATYQTCVKFETDGMAVSVWLFAALLSYLRKRTRGALLLYGALVALAPLAHWTAALFVALTAIALMLLRPRERELATHALWTTIAAGALGAAALLAAMAYLQKGWHPAWVTLTRAFATRSATVVAAAWWERQAAYARQNFGLAYPWVVLGLALFLCVRWLREKSRGGKSAASLPGHGLGLFFASSLAVACVWLFAFPQGSLIHIYWQLWFCLPIAALVAAFVSSLKPGSFVSVAGMAGCVLLLISLLSAAREAYEGILRDQLGRPEDIAFLTSLRGDRFERFVFVPVTETPLNPWFQGPLFEYYTDRALAVAAAAEDLRIGDKALVLRYTPREDVVSRLSAWGGKRLVNEKCSTRLCAYDVAALN